MAVARMINKNDCTGAWKCDDDGFLGARYHQLQGIELLQSEIK